MCIHMYAKKERKKDHSDPRSQVEDPEVMLKFGGLSLWKHKNKQKYRKHKNTCKTQ